jgi:tetratricopeptide (TPR) repeat protein
MKLTPCVKILGCLVLGILTAAAGLSAASGASVPVPAPPGALAEADTLLKSPTLNMSQADKALGLYEGVFAAKTAPRSLILSQLARTCFIVGQLAPDKYSEGFYQKGRVYAEMLIHEYPNRVEGHYWLALNLCGWADAAGYMMARRLLPQIVDQLKQAVALDGGYNQAGPHRVLGRIYYEAPGWPMSVGDISKSLEHLLTAVRLAPENSTNHLFLAQTMYRLHYTSLAEQQLEEVLKCTQYALTPQDLKDDQKEARRLLTEMKNIHRGYQQPLQGSDLP